MTHSKIMTLAPAAFILLILLSLAPGLTGHADAATLYGAETWNPNVIQPAQAYILGTYVSGGRLVDCVIVPGRPPANFRAVALMALPKPNVATGVNVLPNVPAFDWCYGCSATSAAMMMGYYDNNGFPNMYAGPTNGGVCPLTNSAWGSGECPLSATHYGYDARTIRGHVDDYWVGYGSCNQDPFIGNWVQHIQGDCTADFMGTNQSQLGDCDGATTFYFDPSGNPLSDFTATGSSQRDGCHGLRLFAESRGYTVQANFSQYIYGYNGIAKGFTFANYQSEIDAGRPVMIQVSGHSMVGYGYDANNTVYIHDTWDHSDHQMQWGGAYSGLQHYGVTVLRLSTSSSIAVTSFAINNGAASTTSTGVTLNNTTTGSPTQYMAGESSAFVGAVWQTYSAAPSFTLSAGAGTKTVYFKVRDAAGVESTPVSDSISATTSLKVTSFSINNGAASTTSAGVTLNNTAAGSPTDYMASESSSFVGAGWQPYSASPSFTLSSSAGTKTVYFKVRDANGQSAVVSDSITFTIPPQVTSFVINSGAAATTSRYVTLSNTCTGSPYYYMASESSGFAGASWQRYSTGSSFTLSAAAGTKTVYFKVRTSAGLESAPVQDSIVLNVPPVVSNFAINSGAASTTSRDVTLNNVCAGSPTDYMASESSTFSGATWQAYSVAPTFTLSAGNGTKTVYFKVRDANGQSGVVSDAIAVGSNAPIAVTYFAINYGSPSTTSQNVTLSNTCTGSPIYYMASESSSFLGATWKYYSSPLMFLMSAARGQKTIYFKVRNLAGQQSLPVSDTIMY